MNQEISKSLVCVCIRNGAQIWLEADRAANLCQILASADKHRFVNFEGQMINTADIVGIFSASTMEEITRRKNGQWKCFKGNWHDRNEKCEDRVSCSTCKNQCAKEFCQCACHGK